MGSTTGEKHDIEESAADGPHPAPNTADKAAGRPGADREGPGMVGAKNGQLGPGVEAGVDRCAAAGREAES